MDREMLRRIQEEAMAAGMAGALFDAFGDDLDELQRAAEELATDSQIFATPEGEARLVVTFTDGTELTFSL